MRLSSILLVEVVAGVLGPPLAADGLHFVFERLRDWNTSGGWNEYLQGHLNDIVIQWLRTNQPLTKTDLAELEKRMVQIGEEDGESLLQGLLVQHQAPSLAHFVRSLVGMDRAAAQKAFSRLLSNQSLTPPQIRFVQMIIEQLTARGVIEAGALYEPPFTGLHAGGPEGLFAGDSDIITGIFQAIEATRPVLVNAG